MKTSPKVNIILATYNGEKFIENQLDSIIKQTYDNMDIYIRDDGSRDSTETIIQKYAEQSNRNIYILDNEGKNLRCPKSFYEIIRKCKKADYYALSDQDDVWYPHKIEWAVKRLEEERQDIPLVYYSASDYSTIDGKIIRKSPRQKDTLKLNNVLFYTPGSGFTIVFNEKARQQFVLDVNPGKELHDRWLIRCAVCFGKLLYDERSTASHIRHEEAVTAGDAGNGSLVINFIKHELCGEDSIKEKEALAHFEKTFKGKLKDDESKTLKLFTRKNGFVNQCKKIFYPRRLRSRLGGEIALRILFFVGKI